MVTHLAPGTRRVFRILGPILLLVGFVAFPATFFLGFSGFLLSLAALPLFFVGGILTNLGYMRVLTEVAATETGGAVTYSGAALGRGLKEGFGAEMGIRVRCRECGALDTEDAVFCSACGARM